MMKLQPFTLKVLEYVRTHPECSASDIRAAVAVGPKESAAIGKTIQRLRKCSLIENSNGKRGLGATWVAISPSEAAPFYNEVAKDLLSEMKDIHHSQREAYLAERLQEIFS